GSRHAGGSPLRILVVDDDDDVGDGTALLLELLGNRVRVARSGVEALRVACTETPQVVFIDIGMSDMDGFELAGRLRREPALRDAVLVALTGYGKTQDRHQTLAAGFDAHLMKPVKTPELEELLAGAQTRVATSGSGG